MGERGHNPMGPDLSGKSPEEIEKIMANLGMPSELEEDKAAEALREQKEKRAGVNMKEVRNLIRYYWLRRGPNTTWSSHKRRAREIADLYKIESELSLQMMDDVEDEVREAEQIAQEVAKRVVGQAREQGRQVENMERELVRIITNELRANLPDFAKNVRAVIAEAAAEKILFGIN